jgi:isopenicillin-N epimerase
LLCGPISRAAWRQRQNFSGFENNHKWLLAPKGSAFLYARREVQHLVEPLVVSWGYESETPSSSKFIDEQEWTGTRDYAAYLSVPAAIQFTREHDWDAVRRDCHELARFTRSLLTEITGLEPLSPDSAEWFAQMVSLPLPPCNAENLKRRLFDEYRVEAPIITWNGRRLVRVSIQAYNDRDDVRALVDGLVHLLAERA